MEKAKSDQEVKEREAALSQQCSVDEDGTPEAEVISKLKDEISVRIFSCNQK